ncbi:hypothetical protein B5S28_g3324 [[Candida] boidinii]|nr:hypothetical protein B5S28_g3324 [[Candida] boidinii]OWB71856.1 hypothetical protein B5S31_g1551 [[Candida] boidinii]
MRLTPHRNLNFQLDVDFKIPDDYDSLTESSEYESDLNLSKDDDNDSGNILLDHDDLDEFNEKDTSLGDQTIVPLDDEEEEDDGDSKIVDQNDLVENNLKLFSVKDIINAMDDLKLKDRFEYTSNTKINKHSNKPSSKYNKYSTKLNTKDKDEILKLLSSKLREKNKLKYPETDEFYEQKNEYRDSDLSLSSKDFKKLQQRTQERFSKYDKICQEFKRQEEEERKRKEEEERKRREEEERIRREAERKRQEEERKRQEEERKRQEAEAERLRKLAEEKRMREEKLKKEAEEAAELKRKEEEEEEQAKALKEQKKADLKKKADSGMLYRFRSIEAEFLKYKQDIADIKANVVEVMKAPQMKEFKKVVSAHKRKINPKFGQLTDSQRQLTEITNDIRVLVSATASDELAFKWILNFIAKAIISQAESELSVKPQNSIALSKLTLNLLILFPELYYYLMARFVKKCPIIIGYTCTVDTEEGRLRMGWRRDSQNKWEEETKYNERLSGIITLYAVMTRLPIDNTFVIQGGTNTLPANQIKHPMPISNSWRYLSRSLNLKTELLSDVHFVLVGSWWDSCAVEFLRSYDHQAKKVLNLILNDWIGSVAGRRFPGAARLYLLGEEYVKKGKIKTFGVLER